MQFLFSVIDTDAGLASPAEAAAVEAFNMRLKAEGRHVFAAGVAHPATAVTVDDRDGTARVVDGPYVDVPDHLAGFWVVEAADRESAVALALEASGACRRRIEVRALL